jgi:hypothetical protein
MAILELRGRFQPGLRDELPREFFQEPLAQCLADRQLVAKLTGSQVGPGRLPAKAGQVGLEDVAKGPGLAVG